MPLYMLQLAYTAESWAAMVRKPQDRIEVVAKPVLAKAGCKLVGAWYSFGDYDMVLIVEAPDAETMASVPMAVAAGGALRSGQTTPLLSGPEGVGAMQKAGKVLGVYKPPSQTAKPLAMPTEKVAKKGQR